MRRVLGLVAAGVIAATAGAAGPGTRSVDLTTRQVNEWTALAVPPLKTTAITNRGGPGRADRTANPLVARRPWM